MSLIHSVVVGIGSIIAVYQEPALFADLIYTKTPLSFGLALLSFGYIIYDLVDLLRMNNYQLSW